MKALLLTAGLLSACAGFSQTSSVPLADTKDSSDVVAITYGKAKPYTIRNNRNYGGMPNAIAVTPLLTLKTGNNRRGFDLYQLPDGMACLAPDSTNISNMPVVGYQPQRAQKATPDVKIVH